MKQGDMINVMAWVDNDGTPEKKVLSGEFRGWSLCPHSDRVVLILDCKEYGHVIDIDKDDALSIWSAK